ncbi:response regulator [Ktedonobacter racemifer]|uniref:Response regulator receiver protein n=1 Tax=Ktedonobacter racemifer DSM 44963 TaxID=485913 RepID=D6U5C6_KTERA|nr:response regulator [Ktedonobacter racemifer]EFH81706.1 response regulator receiver protein [Ktedonobacter racemifer DSM 44963]
MGKRIVVVDDDQALRLIQELLEDEAYAVDTAIDGLDALGQLDHQRNVYDMILLDLTMLRLNGLQFLHKVQEQDPALLHSIIAISVDEEALRQATGRGICGALKKPFDMEVLLALVVRARC